MVVRALAYDAKGLPSVPEPLARRPAAAGERFSIVHLERGRPVESFDVAVVGGAPDFREPFRVVYRWTRDGLEWGLRGSANVLGALGESGPVFQKEDSRDAAFVAVVVLGVVAAPTAAGAVGGSVMGLADGARATAQELGKLLRGKRERLLTYTLYFYDDRDRLVLTRLYAADQGREVARTRFRYLADAASPTGIEVTDLVEGTSKILQ